MPATDSFERIVTGMAEAENMLRRVSSEKTSQLRKQSAGEMRRIRISSQNVMGFE